MLKIVILPSVSKMGGESGHHGAKPSNAFFFYTLYSVPFKNSQKYEKGTIRKHSEKLELMWDCVTKCMNSI